MQKSKQEVTKVISLMKMAENLQSVSSTLGVLDTLSRFLSYSTRETTFGTSCLLSCIPSPSEMASTQKGKNLLPKGLL